MKKLFGWFVLVLIVWAAYHQASESMTPTTDAYLLGYIAVSSMACVVVMLVWTSRWRLLSLGLLSFFTATGLLYVRVSSAGLGYDLWQTRLALSLIRALYLISGTFTLVATIRHMRMYADRAFPWIRKKKGACFFFVKEDDDGPPAP